MIYKGIKRFDQVYNVSSCPENDLAITLPFPDKKELYKLYSSENYRDHDKRFIDPVEVFIRFLSKWRFKNIQNFCKKGRILDIGCGRGQTLLVAKEKGWETHGIEFSDDSADHARNRLKLDVRTGSIQDAEFEHESFDVITIWQVLEHMEDPERTIRECYKLLKTGGILVISVPNRDSVQSKISGKDWFHLDIPYHLYHFSTRDIKKLLKKFSFRTEKVDHFSLDQNFFGFLQSFLNISGISHNFLYNILKTGKLRMNINSMKHLKDLLLTILLLPLYVPLSILFSALEAVLGRGGTVAVYARKH